MRGAERCIYMKVMSSACAFVLAAIAVVWGAGLAGGISRLICVGCVFGNVSAAAAVPAAAPRGRLAVRVRARFANDPNADTTVVCGASCAEALGSLAREAARRSRY